MEAPATVSNPSPNESPAACLTEAASLLQDIRLSLDARYAAESEEDEAQADEEHALPWLGMGVALAAFVPTFLSIVLGVPLLLATVFAPASEGPTLAQVAGHSSRPHPPRRSRGPTTAPSATRGSRVTGSPRGRAVARRSRSSSPRPTW